MTKRLYTWTELRLRRQAHRLPWQHSAFPLPPVSSLCTFAMCTCLITASSHPLPTACWAAHRGAALPTKTLIGSCQLTTIFIGCAQKLCRWMTKVVSMDRLQASTRKHSGSGRPKRPIRSMHFVVWICARVVTQSRTCKLEQVPKLKVQYFWYFTKVKTLEFVDCLGWSLQNNTECNYDEDIFQTQVASPMDCVDSCLDVSYCLYKQKTISC